MRFASWFLVLFVLVIVFPSSFAVANAPFAGCPHGTRAIAQAPGQEFNLESASKFRVMGWGGGGGGSSSPMAPPPPPPPPRCVPDIKQGDMSPTDVRKHNTPKDCYMTIAGTIYDLTSYLARNSHPGKNDVLTPNCGNDVTEQFNTKHGNRNFISNFDELIVGQTTGTDQETAREVLLQELRKISGGAETKGLRGSTKKTVTQNRWQKLVGVTPSSSSSNNNSGAGKKLTNWNRFASGGGKKTNWGDIARRQGGGSRTGTRTTRTSSGTKRITREVEPPEPTSDRPEFPEQEENKQQQQWEQQQEEKQEEQQQEEEQRQQEEKNHQQSSHQAGEHREIHTLHIQGQKDNRAVENNDDSVVVVGGDYVPPLMEHQKAQNNEEEAAAAHQSQAAHEAAHSQTTTSTTTRTKTYIMDGSAVGAVGSEAELDDALATQIARRQLDKKHKKHHGVNVHVNVQA